MSTGYFIMELNSTSEVGVVVDNQMLNDFTNTTDVLITDYREINGTSNDAS